MYSVYKISNGDFTYYGSTTNFKDRMRNHKYFCTNETTNTNKKYKIIREHGGWEAFTKEIIEQNIDTEVKARQREEHYRKIDGNMNMISCYLTEEERIAYKNCPSTKAKLKEWSQLPKVRAKKKAYDRLPSTKAKRKAYNADPINKAKLKAYYEHPSTKERLKAWRATPKQVERRKATKKAYRDNPINKAKENAYREKNKAYLSEKVICDCGSIVRRDTMTKARHLTTKKHIKGVVKNLLDEYINQVLEIV